MKAPLFDETGEQHSELAGDLAYEGFPRGVSRFRKTRTPDARNRLD